MDMITPEIPCDRVGMVARFKPVHLGHAAILRALHSAGRVQIGLGSSNRYNARNPFTAAESAAMIRLVLAERSERCRLIEIPDLDDGPRWKDMVREIFGDLDFFVTANSYVRNLMEPHYHVVHPAQIVPPQQHVPVDGTMVRMAMASGSPWEKLVPNCVAEYIRANGLDVRFINEFGLATLAAALEPPKP